MKATLKEIALEMGYTAENFTGAQGWKEDSFQFLALDERFAVMQDDKGLHLTDLISWARFSPIKIGRKSSITRKGLEFQIAQLRLYKKQKGLA
jgi:hypothetical protein